MTSPPHCWQLRPGPPPTALAPLPWTGATHAWSSPHLMTTAADTFTIAYDGTDFQVRGTKGRANRDGRAARGVELVVCGPADPVGAGRTDAGVHGWGQVVSLDLPVDTDLAGLQRRVNRMCGPASLCATSVGADPEFHARYSATYRLYRYHVLNSPSEPLRRSHRLARHRTLQLWAMNLACDPLIGEHDFATFCRRRSGAADHERSLVGTCSARMEGGPRRRTRPPAVRDPRQCVLPPDGAFDRRHARGRRRRQAARGRRARHSAVPDRQVAGRVARPTAGAVGSRLPGGGGESLRRRITRVCVCGGNTQSPSVINWWRTVLTRPRNQTSSTQDTSICHVVRSKCSPVKLPHLAASASMSSSTCVRRAFHRSTDAWVPSGPSLSSSSVARVRSFIRYSGRVSKTSLSHPGWK